MKHAAACVAAVAVLLTGAPAFATDFPLGDFGPGTGPFAQTPVLHISPFEDTFTFTLLEMLSAAITIQTIDVGSFVVLELDAPTGDIIFDSTSAKLSIFEGKLLAGTYTVNVAGTPSGSHGGQYTFAIAVPEPGAALLMVLGLAGLVLVGRLGAR